MLQSPSSLEHAWHFARDHIEEIRHSRDDSFWLYEIGVWWHMLANSLLSIYIPVLLFILGFSVENIVLFFVITHLVNVPANFVSYYLIGRIGPKYVMTIATLFQIAFFVVYALISADQWALLILLGALTAIYDGLYYPASFYLFMDSTKDIENTGKNTGILYAVVRSAGLVGPIIGSTILLTTGNVAWVVAAVITGFLISLIPLFRSNLPQPAAQPFSDLWAVAKRESFAYNYGSLICYKIHETVNDNLWPLFIFTYFAALESVAALAILVPLVALVFSFLSGHIKPAWRVQAIGVGAVVLAAVWFGRLMFADGVWFYASVIIAGLFALLIQVPVDANIFRSGKIGNSLAVATLRNAVSMGSKGIFFLLLYVMMWSFESAFVITLVALVLLVFMQVWRLIKWDPNYYLK